MGLHGKTVTMLNSQLATAEGERDAAKEQLTANQTELDTLKESAKGNADLEQRLTDLQAKFDESKMSSEKQLAEQQKDFSIRLALKEAQARDEDIVLSQLDKDTIKLVDGKLQGFGEQLQTLQESKAFLFQSQEQNEGKPTPKIFTGGNPRGAEGENKTLAQKIQERLGE